MYKKVGVLLGGVSAEREVSLNSGENACKALDNLGLNYVKIDPADGLIEQLERHKPDVVLNMLHGTYGEDGAIAGLLELMEIPYSHSGTLASAIGMNKIHTKNELHGSGICVATSLQVEPSKLAEEIKKGTFEIDPPFVVKPIDQGSTVGIYVVDKNFDVSIIENWEYGDKLMVEDYVGGIDLTTAVLNGKALGTLEIEPKKGNIVDYEAKYTEGAAEHIFPPRVPMEIEQTARKWAETAHEKIGCRTISRSDFRYDKDRPIGQQLVFLEINTHPGYTKTSNVPDILKNIGMSSEDFIMELLKGAKCDLKRIGNVHPSSKIKKA